MRKPLIALLVALAPLAASAQSLQINRSQTGRVGALVTATDPSGNTGKVVLQGAMLTDSAGAEKGVSANPVIVQPATGSSGQVVGNVAAASADSGNPVKIGCVFNTAAQVYTNGQRADAQCDNNGGLRIWGAAVSGSGGGNNFVQVGGQDPSFNFRGFRTDTGGTQLTGRVTPGNAITASSGNVANASAVATLAGTAGRTTQITGFQCTAAGATAASVVSVTVTGTISGTMTYTFVFPAGVTAGATPLNVNFSTPVPASATNTAIVVTLPAGGAGNTNASCSAQGFQL